MTFIGPGLLYMGDEIIHKVVLDRLAIGRAWDRRVRRVLADQLYAVECVLSCVPRLDRQGELSITVSAWLGEEQHWATLRRIANKLVELQLYGGDIERILPVSLCISLTA